MNPEDMPDEVHRMFDRQCDLDATVEQSLWMLTMLTGKLLATYAPNPDAARLVVEQQSKTVWQLYEKLCETYAKEGHPLARRRPN